MNGANALTVVRTPSGPRLAPSRDALRLMLSGLAYLLAICLLQIAVMVEALRSGSDSLTGHLMDVRDVIALFGWVGLTISGVSVIIVPSHLGTSLRPSSLPRLHLVLANIGLVDFFLTTLIQPGSNLQDVALAVVSFSYLIFGAGVFATAAPFLRRRNPPGTASPRPSGRDPPSVS